MRIDPHESKQTDVLTLRVRPALKDALRLAADERDVTLSELTASLLTRAVFSGEHRGKAAA